MPDEIDLDRITYVLRPERDPSALSNRIRPETPIALSDEEFEAKTDDPSQIATHDEALAILLELDQTIAQIQSQIDAYAIEAQSCEMPPERQAWLRRAAYAGAMNRNHRHRVMMRDRELRLIRRDPPPPPKDKAVNLLKQERLKIEAEQRRLATATRHAAQQVLIQDIPERRALSVLFQEIARERLSRELFDQFIEEAKTRRAMMLGTRPTDAGKTPDRKTDLPTNITVRDDPLAVLGKMRRDEA